MYFTLELTPVSINSVTIVQRRNGQCSVSLFNNSCLTTCRRYENLTMKTHSTFVEYSNPCNSLSSFTYKDSVHVIYIATSKTTPKAPIHQLYWNNKWCHLDLTSLCYGNNDGAYTLLDAANALGEVETVCGLSGGVVHVFFKRENDPNIYELYWNGKSWRFINLSSKVRASPMAERSCISTFVRYANFFN
jgi:hypothetical protein